MIQPPRLLPSNAPRLPTEGNDAAPRVLQEHSGNRHQCYPFAPNYEEQKYGPSRSTENACPAPPAQDGYPLHPQLHAVAWPLDFRRSGYGRGAYGPKSTWPPRDPTVEATKLYKRFLSSDQYAKYRQRQHKDDKSNQEQKWPDRLEEAFFQGTSSSP